MWTLTHPNDNQAPTTFLPAYHVYWNLLLPKPLSKMDNVTWFLRIHNFLTYKMNNPRIQSGIGSTVNIESRWCLMVLWGESGSKFYSVSIDRPTNLKCCLVWNLQYPLHQVFWQECGKGDIIVWMCAGVMEYNIEVYLTQHNCRFHPFTMLYNDVIHCIYHWLRNKLNKRVLL